MAEASAVEEPETPASITLVTMLAWPSPPRKWPTRATARSTIRTVMPPAFITAAARMKNGIASNVKELSAPDMFCVIVTSISGGNGVSPANEPMTRAKTMGTSAKIKTSDTTIRMPVLAPPANSACPPSRRA